MLGITTDPVHQITCAQNRPDFKCLVDTQAIHLLMYVGSESLQREHTWLGYKRSRRLNENRLSLVQSPRETQQCCSSRCTNAEPYSYPVLVSVLERNKCAIRTCGSCHRYLLHRFGGLGPKLGELAWSSPLCTQLQQTRERTQVKERGNEEGGGSKKVGV